MKDPVEPVFDEPLSAYAQPIVRNRAVTRAVTHAVAPASSRTGKQSHRQAVAPAETVQSSLDGATQDGETIHNEPVPITPERVVEALRVADQTGQERKKEPVLA